MAGNPYMDAFNQFSAMQQPDPNTFLKLIWPHLDINTRSLIKALLTPPSASPAAAAPQAPAMDAASQGAAPSGMRLLGTSADKRYHIFEAGDQNATLDTQTGQVIAKDGGTYGGPQPGAGAKVMDPKLAPTVSKQNVAPEQQGKRKATLQLGDAAGTVLDIF